MSRSMVERKLLEVSERLKQLRAELRVTDEQVLHFADVADDARLRALVSETPCQIASEKHVAVLILTAFSHRDLIEKARDAGALAYLVKRFQKSELIPAVEVALGRFQEMKALADENLSLADQLETRKLVDRAKGKLMDLHGMSEGDAFGFLRKTAMDTRSTLKAVAGDVLDGTLKP